MRKAYKFRIYPTKKQKSAMEQTLDICCELYNAALQERRDAYRIASISITYQDQQNQLPEIKKIRDDLKSVHSQVLQDVLKRLDNGMQAFFRRVKAGEKPGFPRFRSRSRYNSLTYAQSGFTFDNGKLALSKIGHIKIKLHRRIEGTIKTCALTRSATGKWYACFSCEIEPTLLAVSAVATGADAGLNALLTLSDGSKIEAPEFFRQEEKALAKEQRKLSELPKGSKERKQQRKVVARVHERITNKRTNYAHQLSHCLILVYGIIIFENLTIKNMLKNHCLAKSIADAAWKQIVRYTIYKAEYAGRYVGLVDPRFTSQDCHRCHNRRTDLKLSDRVYHCTNPECLLQIDRDHNAALNILALGLQSVGYRAIEAASL